ACFQRAETLSPGMKDALSGIGWALRSLGRFEEADNYFHKSAPSTRLIRDHTDTYPARAKRWRPTRNSISPRCWTGVAQPMMLVSRRGLALDACWTKLEGMTRRSPGMQPRMPWSVRSGPRWLICSTQTASPRKSRG